MSSDEICPKCPCKTPVCLNSKNRKLTLPGADDANIQKRHNENQEVPLLLPLPRLLEAIKVVADAHFPSSLDSSSSRYVGALMTDITIIHAES